MRDEFVDEVRRVLAARAGNTCSNPECRALTSGPQQDSAKALNLGVAAHITAASEGGPRFDSTLSSQDRRHPDNGIWLCQNCAKRIDNDTSRYTIDLVRAWKLIAEDRARNSVGKTATSDPERLSPVLAIDFANLSLREKLGTSTVLKSGLVEIPPLETIRSYGPEPPTGPYGIPLDAYDGLRNRDYYRDLAVYVRDKSLLRPIGVAVTNLSPIVAQEVVVTIELAVASDLTVIDESDTPVKPSTMFGPAIRPINRNQRVHVSRYGDRYEVRCQIGTVQPKTIQWSSEPFYVGAKVPMTISPRLHLAANNLPAPITLEGSIDIQISRRSITPEDIRNARS